MNSTKPPRDYAPRGLRLPAAASYMGIKPTKFVAAVKAGILPAPRRLDGCVIWDRHQLDDAFDELPRQGRD